MVTSPVRVLPMGEGAVLVEAADADEVPALRSWLAESAPPGVVELVPAARTVLVRVDPGRLSRAEVVGWVEGFRPGARLERVPGRLHRMEVVYDGLDLGEAAAALGWSADELVRRHSAEPWEVAFTGFAPGFGYLVRSDWDREVPRRANPRPRVPRGSVALAGRFSGAYPRESPGGWQLIGRTGADLFRPRAEPPVLWEPGDRVLFQPVRSVVQVTAAAASATGGAAALRVERAGAGARIEDLGRDGRAHQGIARSGVLDRAALRRANRVLGTHEDAPGIEVTMGEFAFTALRDVWVAAAGAWASLSIAGRPTDPFVPNRVLEGERVAFGAPERGARVVVAVRGGLAVPLEAGSASTDTMSGLGPESLRAGDLLTVGDRIVGEIPPMELVPWSGPQESDREFALAPGPRADWFTDRARAALYESVWTVSAQADRAGVRLEGPALERARPGEELPSEPMVPGAIQVPPSGAPTVLLADGPVTGGYPVIAVVADSCLDGWAQVRPGDRVRFRHLRDGW